jgi:hypothetical protein
MYAVQQIDLIAVHLHPFQQIEKSGRLRPQIKEGKIFNRRIDAEYPLSFH